MIPCFRNLTALMLQRIITVPRMLTSTVAVARPLLLTASIMYVAESSLFVLAMDTVE